MYDGEIEPEQFEFPMLYGVSGFVLSFKELDEPAAVCDPGEFSPNEVSLEL